MTLVRVCYYLSRVHNGENRKERLGKTDGRRRRFFCQVQRRSVDKFTEGGDEEEEAEEAFPKQQLTLN